MKSGIDESETVGRLRADRLCPSCGANLIGQSICRERHYGLLIVTCPGCDRIVSCQEYPALGEWPGRWRAVLAAIWIMFLLLCVVLSMSLCANRINLYNAASTRLKIEIAQAHLEWFQGEYPTPELRTGQLQNDVSSSPTSSLHPEWWSRQDGDEFIRRAGGLAQSIRWPDLSEISEFMIMCAAVGVFWSVILCHWKRRWLWLVSIAAGLLVWWTTLATYNSPWWENSAYYGGNWISVSNVAQSYVISHLCLPVAIGAAGLFYIGLMLGRPLARAIIRALLAPRLRGPFSFFWTCDGLEPPVPGASLRLGHQ